MAKASKNVLAYLTEREFDQLDDYLVQHRRMNPKPNKSNLIRVGIQLVLALSESELKERLENLPSHEE